MTTSRQSGRKNKNVTPTASKSQSRPAGTAKTTTGSPPPAPEQAAPLKVGQTLLDGSPDLAYRHVVCRSHGCRGVFHDGIEGAVKDQRG